MARVRIRQYFKALWSNTDKKQYKLAMDILNDKYLWMEEDIIGIYHKESGQKEEEIPVVKSSLSTKN